MIDFNNSIISILSKSLEANLSHFRPVLNKYNLTIQQWRVIRVLIEENGLDSNELAERTLILRPSMTGVIDRMTRDGLVERKKAKDDGRKIKVWLTRKGRRLFHRVIPTIEYIYNDLQRRFTVDKWTELYTLLEELNVLCKEGANLPDNNNMD